MHLAQITDIHISADHQPVHEVDVVSNFEKVLQSVLSDEQVSHIVLTGDLCFQDGSISTMEWVKEKMEATGMPYYTIPGNHDDSVIMGQVFDMEASLHGSELYYNIEMEDLHLIFLDSGKGWISVDQLSWLKAVDSMIEKPSLVFMHHPPVQAVPYMDANYALEGREEVQRILSGLKHVRAVFTGHYHVGKTIQQHGLPPVHITPSTFFQLDDTDEEFRVGTKAVAWRKISWHNGQLQTSVKWL
jgi:Icc protein